MVHPYHHSYISEPPWYKAVHAVNYASHPYSHAGPLSARDGVLFRNPVRKTYSEMLLRKHKYKWRTLPSSEATWDLPCQARGHCAILAQWIWIHRGRTKKGYMNVRFILSKMLLIWVNLPLWGKYDFEGCHHPWNDWCHRQKVGPSLFSSLSFSKSWQDKNVSIKIMS